MRFMMGLQCGGLLLALASGAQAQPRSNRDEGSRAGTPDTFVARLMTFDANQDGQLTIAEMTDLRLQPLLERADVNHDGVTTRQELLDLFAVEAAAIKNRPRRGPMGPPPSGPPGGRGPRRGPPPPDRSVDQNNSSPRQNEELRGKQGVSTPELPRDSEGE